MKLRGVIGIVVLAASSAVGLHGSVHAATAHKVVKYPLRGTLTAPVCSEGYEIEEANVVVRDQSNKIIGVTNTSDNLANPDDVMADCKVSFTVKVPKAQMYQIKIGSHEGPTYSFGQLQSRHWKVALSLD